MRNKVRTLALPVGAVVVLGLGAAWLPSYAQDDGDDSRDAAAQHATVGSGLGAEEPHTHDEEGEPHSHDEDAELEPYFDRVDDEGNVIPEKPHDGHINFQTIDSIAELEAVEKQVDPHGSPDTYVCANLGSREVKVIKAYPRDPDMKPKTAAEAAKDGPITGEAPCEGYSMVVGK